MRTILDLIHKGEIEKRPEEMMENYIANIAPKALETSALGAETSADAPIDDRTKEETEKDDTDLYNISNFSV